MSKHYCAAFRIKHSDEYTRGFQSQKFTYVLEHRTMQANNEKYILESCKTLNQYIFHFANIKTTSANITMKFSYSNKKVNSKSVLGYVILP